MEGTCFLPTIQPETPKRHLPWTSAAEGLLRDDTCTELKMPNTGKVNNLLSEDMSERVADMLRIGPLSRIPRKAVS